MKSKTKFITYTVLFLGILAIIVALAIPQFATYRSSGTRNISFNPPIYYEEEVCPTYTKFNTEAYDYLQEHPFLKVAQNPLSTFGIDVDTASYANIRRFIRHGRMPPKDAVRIEEMINYFTYNYPTPSTDKPFSVRTEVANCPWQENHKLLSLALKGKELAEGKRPPSNLVFLLDVSGSMDSPDKLPLLKRAMKLLVRQLGDDDRVAIVVYAGAAGLVLSSTTCTDKNKKRILHALDELHAGGSTHGSQGIRLAYQTAETNFLKDGTNRVILATDGDFNVGITSRGELVRLIEDKAETGIFLTVLGFGTGNLKDSTMEQLADKGNGNYAYIDSLREARKVLVEQIAGTLVTIAKDVKIQVEFNPTEVSAYRLIGYENRSLRSEDFNDDKKDAGEIGAGHTVTALYEVVPAGQEMELPGVDPLKYQKTSTISTTAGELLTVKLRYKEPDGDSSKLMAVVVKDGDSAIEHASNDFRFASAVAAFGMLLRDSPNKGRATYEDVIQLARSAMDHDEQGYRSEFINLVRHAKDIASL
jgi:Ca-activated chloride channel family protein